MNGNSSDFNFFRPKQCFVFNRFKRKSFPLFIVPSLNSFSGTHPQTGSWIDDECPHGKYSPRYIIYINVYIIYWSHIYTHTNYRIYRICHCMYRICHLMEWHIWRWSDLSHIYHTRVNARVSWPISATHLIYRYIKYITDDSDISDVFTRYSNIWLVHISDMSLLSLTYSPHIYHLPNAIGN